MAQKTKKQKQQADLRRISQPVKASVPLKDSSATTDTPAVTYSFKPKAEKVKPGLPLAYTSSKKDLIKTGIITSSIVLAQLLLFFLMQLNIVNLSF